VVGLARGDRILKVGDSDVPTWQALRLQILEAALRGHLTPLSVMTAGGVPREVVLDLSAVDRENLEKDYLAALGLMPERPWLPAVVGSVAPDGAAALAGLQVGDLITQVDEQWISHWGEVVAAVRASPGRVINVHYTRGGETLEAVVLVGQVSENGATVGRVGLGPKLDPTRNKNLIRVYYNPLEAMGNSIAITWDTTRLSLSVMWKMLWGEVSWRNLSGPVAIADYAGRTAAMGPSAYVRFIALVSISLGIVNLLPIPVLDGGHLMYYFAELIRRRPVSEKTMLIGQKIGFALLIMLMAFALFNDINRLIASLSG
jgi:regulator of sigma E protease